MKICQFCGGKATSHRLQETAKVFDDIIVQQKKFKCRDCGREFDIYEFRMSPSQKMELIKLARLGREFTEFKMRFKNAVKEAREKRIKFLSAYDEERKAFYKKRNQRRLIANRRLAKYKAKYGFDAKRIEKEGIDMNKIILLGRVTRDIEYKATTGSGYARFTVAVDRPKGKDQQETTVDFINCVAWGKTGEIIAKYFHKGSKILVEGRLQIGSYTNKDNQKVNTADVFVSNFEFVESKSNSSNNSNNSNNIQQSPMSSFGSSQPFDNIEDIPF